MVEFAKCGIGKSARRRIIWLLSVLSRLALLPVAGNKLVVNDLAVARPHHFDRLWRTNAATTRISGGTKPVVLRRTRRASATARVGGTCSNSSTEQMLLENVVRARNQHTNTVFFIFWSAYHSPYGREPWY